MWRQQSWQRFLSNSFISCFSYAFLILLLIPLTIVFTTTTLTWVKEIKTSLLSVFFSLFNSFHRRLPSSNVIQTTRRKSQSSSSHFMNCKLIWEQLNGQSKVRYRTETSAYCERDDRSQTFLLKRQRKIECDFYAVLMQSMERRKRRQILHLLVLMFTR